MGTGPLLGVMEMVWGQTAVMVTYALRIHEDSLNYTLLTGQLGGK